MSSNTPELIRPGGTADANEEESERLTDLMRIADESDEAKEKFYRLVYDDLRSAARRLIRRQAPQDLRATELVHEVFQRFEASGTMREFKNRRVFFSVAIRAMRQVLIDNYRRRKKLVDSPDRQAVPLEDIVDSIERRLGYDIERLELALRRLEEESPRQYAVITYRFFCGLSIAAAAELLDVSRPTVERDWKLARAKLFRMMKHDT